MKTLSILSLVIILASQALIGEPSVNDNQCVLLPVHGDPTISFRIEFLVGFRNDPQGKEGIAAITGQMLTDAATTRNSYDAILDQLFPLAASYDASVNAEQTVIYGRVHKDNLKEYVPLLLDAILHPAFKQEDLDRIKSQTLNYLQNTIRYSSDEELGKAVLYNTVFAGTPYGHISAGTVSSVQSISIDDVRAFYTKFFTQANLVIGLGGGYDDALLAQLKNGLSALPAGVPVQQPKPAPALPKVTRTVLIEKDAPATAISLGFPITILRGEKDFYPLALATSWLGEHRNSSSHLYQVIRESRGLNYGDYAYIESYPNGGMRSTPPQNVCRNPQLFEIWIRPVPNETRVFALRAAVREFDRLVGKGLSEKDFELTRNFLSKYTLHFAPTTMERLGYALDDRYYGITGSHLENYRTALKQMTLKDVNAAIKKYWGSGVMTIAVVTKDAAAMRDALLSNAPSPITYKTPKPESVLTEDKDISSYPLGVKDAVVVGVEDLFK
jgi:zinc protease